MTSESNQPIIAYKGFDANLACRGYQFQVGMTYEHDGDVRVCASGFHACEYPLDLFSYYEPSKSRFCSVELAGQISRDGSYSKIAGAKLTQTNTGDMSAATNTGDMSAATNTGDMSAATNTGYRSAAKVDGRSSVAIATGDESSASACEGSAIVLVRRNADGELTHVFASIVGQNGIKPDVMYTLDEDGKPVEQGGAA